jgi:tRNA pseudouridine38-40 synthase
MKRFFFEISYDGSPFFGWQRQPRQISVQGEIEEALSRLFSNQQIPIVGCGRTDTGVHAKSYFFHADLPEDIEPNQIVYKLNKMISPAIAFHRAFPVRVDLHARFSATSRTYRYFLHASKNPFLKDYSLYFPGKLDVEAMNQAAKFLVGKQDFTSLSKLHTDVKTNICTVSIAEWQQEGEQWYFEITADRFLRNMVRATVGTLLEIGQGKLAPEEMLRILQAKDRSAAAVSVPAHGLFLWQIEYPCSDI